MLKTDTEVKFNLNRKIINNKMSTKWNYFLPSYKTI